MINAALQMMKISVQNMPITLVLIVRFGLILNMVYRRPYPGKLVAVGYDPRLDS